jgi:hypothetical protein
VNKSEVIGKLEALLDRVRSRAVRGGKPIEAAAREPVTEPPHALRVAEATRAVPPMVATPEPARAAEPQHEEPSWPTEPPPPPEPAPAIEAPHPVASMDSDAPEVEEVAVVWGETTLLESESEIEQTTEAHDSRERLVAAEPAPVESPVSEPSAELGDGPEELTGIHIAVPEPAAVAAPPPAGRVSEPPMDVTELDLESPEEHDQEHDEEEEPPISSRRVVSAEPEERLAEMAFGAEEPLAPIHTPPPESGRLPAAPGGFEPEADLAESGRLPASPPETFEADPDITGVRSATPLLPLRPLQPMTKELVAEATQVARAPSEEVVDVIAEAQRFAPSTFVALLDASLGL